MSTRGYKAFLIGTRRDLEQVIALMQQAGPSGLESAGQPGARDVIMQSLPIIESVIAEIKMKEAEYAQARVPKFQRRPSPADFLG